MFLPKMNAGMTMKLSRKEANVIRYGLQAALTTNAYDFEQEKMAKNLLTMYFPNHIIKRGVSTDFSGLPTSRSINP